MRLVAAELVESRQILPGQWLQSFHAPELASGSRAGQFVHVRTGDYSGLVLRRPFSINTADPATGIVTLHFRTVGRGTEWLTRVREGDRLDMLGPLGRPFEVRSTQARGRGIGARLLVPTVNLAAYDGLLPAFGVYVTRLTVGGRRFQAVTNVGNRPTFGEASFAVESHILDFEPVDVDEAAPIELEFLLRLRGEQQWPTPEALKAQIFEDIAKAKRYFRLEKG